MSYSYTPMQQDPFDPPSRQERNYNEFIGVYDGAVEPGLCKWLIDFIDTTAHLELKSRDMVGVKDKQICLDAFAPREADILMQSVNDNLLNYTNEYPFLKGSDYVSGNVILQKTEPSEGYHTFHAENHAWRAKDRTMAWMVFLNNVNEGGETEFLYQKTRLSPKKGTIVIWPGGFTHLHRGNPPLNSTKYIATGWYQACGGIEQKIVKGEGLQ